MMSRPVTLYVVTKAADKADAQALVATVLHDGDERVDQRGHEKRIRAGNPLSPHRHRMLMLLDEFASLGKLTTFQDAMSKCAGYGIKCYLLAQDREQIIDAYGLHESITSHCHVKSLYAPTKPQHAGLDLRPARAIHRGGLRRSPRAGTGWSHAQRQPHVSCGEPASAHLGGGRTFEGAAQAGDRIVETGQVLVLVAGRHPILGEQALYFQDPTFLERAKEPPQQMPAVAAAETDISRVR